jgi:hypothetical protein
MKEDSLCDIRQDSISKEENIFGWQAGMTTVLTH